MRNIWVCLVAGLMAMVLAAPAGAQTIDFGDDLGSYANDNECDDPRFTGVGASDGFDDHRFHDAADCRNGYEAGSVTLVQSTKNADKLTAIGAPAIAVASVDFGDDSSQYANDGECDDPRFTGVGSADLVIDRDAYRDATDCRGLFEALKITLRPVDPLAMLTVTLDDGARVELGDNTSDYADNGECDDPRFEGAGMASVLIEADRLHDAIDCRAGLQKRTIALIGSAPVTTVPSTSVAATLPDGTPIEFGDDNSSYANNGECDDPRFEGDGTSSVLLSADRLHDAADCRMLLAAGRISYALVPTVDSAGVEFGDDSSSWADDGECDDPRFTGVGMATTPAESETLRDAADCREQYEAGRVTLAAATPTDAGPLTVTLADGTVVDFGDNTSSYANNGECDDSRFQGEGSADLLVTGDYRHDAADCKSLYDSGGVTYALVRIVNSTGIEFGDDTGQYPDDGECDDPGFEGVGMAGPPLDDADRLHDASDCRLLYEAGKITVIAAEAPMPTTIPATPTAPAPGPQPTTPTPPAVMTLTPAPQTPQGG